MSLIIKIFSIIFIFVLSLEDIFAEEKKDNVSLYNFIPKLESKNSDYSLKFKGRLMIDIGQEFNSSKDNEILVRRSRIEAFGKVGENFSYLNSYNINHKNTELVDAFITFEGIKNLKITAGHLVANNNIEGKTSSLTNPFMERSISYLAFNRHRRLGTLFNYFKEDWSIKLGAFGSELEKNQIADKSRLVNFRSYFLPIKNNDNSHYLHLGINGSYQKIESFDKSLSFKSETPDIIKKTIANTGSIDDIKSYKQYIPEVRYQNGPLSINLEYYKSYLERKNRKNLKFSGGYISASYFLSNSFYKYGIEDGTPEFVINSKNAIEIISRYSYLDLNDKEISGGKVDSYDFGANYYFNDNAKIMLSYVIDKTRKSSFILNKTSQLLIARIQLNF